MTRLLRRLHAHGLNAKIPHSRRWRVSLAGSRIMAAALKPEEALDIAKAAAPKPPTGVDPRHQSRHACIGLAERLCGGQCGGRAGWDYGRQHLRLARRSARRRRRRPFPEDWLPD
jgi:hypothetical protein